MNMTEGCYQPTWRIAAEVDVRGPALFIIMDLASRLPLAPNHPPHFAEPNHREQAKQFVESAWMTSRSIIHLSTPSTLKKAAIHRH